MIQENAWPYGHKLPSQRALAETLGISRPTVREALVALETMTPFTGSQQERLLLANYLYRLANSDSRLYRQAPKEK